SEGLQLAFYRLAQFSFLSGKLLRTLHRNNLAYMDGHMGNMSLLIANKMVGLYATDLGSMYDFSTHSYKDRYKGLDVYMYVKSAVLLFNSFVQFLSEQTSKPIQSIHTDLLEVTIHGLAAGYFEEEVCGEQRLSLMKTIEAASGFGDGLIMMLGTTDSAQYFTEVFEELLSRPLKSTIASRSR
ncbi:MAG: hypothetical protein AAB649_05305, partial [Patescibacteria group bacterium]